MEILNLAGDMGWHRAAGPTGVFTLAVVPRRGLEAMCIFRSNNGAETVMIHPDTYAIWRFNKRTATDLKGQNPKELIRAYQAEGHLLNMQIQVYAGEWDLDKPLTLHKIKAEEAKAAEKLLVGNNSELQVEDVTTPTHLSPAWKILNDKGEKAAECLYTMGEEGVPQHRGRKDSQQTGTPVFSEGGEEHTQGESDSSGESVPVDLPCAVCNDPGKWETMILCDGGCHRGFHIECIKLQNIPAGKRQCQDCGKGKRMKNQQRANYSSAEVIDLTGTSDAEGSTKQLAATAMEDLTANTVEQEIEPLEDKQEALDRDIYDDVQAMHFLMTGGLLDHCEGDAGKRELKRVAKRATNYKYAGGVLFKRPTSKHPSMRQVPAKKDRQEICKEVHELNHMGVKRMLSAISSRWYWANMTADIKATVEGCDACKRKGMKTLKEDPELKPIKPADIFRRVHIDMLGPMPKTERGNKWVCIAVDSLSKWPFAKATVDKSSGTTAHFLLENIIAEHGVPSEVVSDRGAEFLGEFSSLLEKCGITHRMTSSYHPQGNGLGERMAQNILHALQRAAMKDPLNWDLELPWILLGQRAVKCLYSSKMSPAMMVYGRELVLPAERKRIFTEEVEQDKLPPPQPDMNLADDSGLPHEVHETLQQRGEALNEKTKQALDNIEQAQEQQKKAYRKRRGLVKDDPKTLIPPGSMVLMKVPAKNKLSAGCEGPYKIVEWQGDQSRALLEDAEGKQWTCHSNRVALYQPAGLGDKPANQGL
jgi:hypothetical protein